MQTLKIVYYSVVYSHLNYCVSTWGMASHNALDPLIKLHKRIVRIITKSPPLTPTLPLFKKLNFLKIEEICKFEIAKKMYQYKTTGSPKIHLINALIPVTQTHQHSTRLATSVNYHLPRKRTNQGKKSFSYIGPKVWQMVPSEFKLLLFSNFKYKLKKYFISKYQSSR